MEPLSLHIPRSRESGRITRKPRSLETFSAQDPATSGPNIVTSVSARLFLVLTSRLVVLPDVEALDTGEPVAVLLGAVLSRQAPVLVWECVQGEKRTG